MDQRKRIGLVYNLNKSWMAGAYYLEHIIKACMDLPVEQQPELLVFYNNEEAKLRLEKLDYPLLDLQQINFPVRLINKLFLETLGWTPLSAKIHSALPQAAYPYIETLGYRAIPGKYFWIPDFQDHYYPELFPTAEIKRRKKLYTRLSKSAQPIVFSSKNARSDFQHFYPQHNNDLKLLRFASLPPAYTHLQMADLRNKFDIDRPYFIVSNQFWQHKNHQVVLEAIHALAEKQLDYQVVFTGSPTDPRNKAHFATLNTYIEDHQLSPWIRMLGFIDRAEQLQLMNHAVAVIQPSLFEGWSTVVEDSKALNQFILLSNIQVHQEQISQNCTFFDPHNATALAQQMAQLLQTPPQRIQLDYAQNVRQFALDFIALFSDS